MNGALGRADRALLLVPLAGGLVFGILPFFAQQAFATATGYSGADAYVYRLAGAATVGYAVALGLGIRDQGWADLLWVVLATLAFNVVSIVACAIEIARGRAQPVVYLILAASIVILAITTRLHLGPRRRTAGPRRFPPLRSMERAVGVSQLLRKLGRLEARLGDLAIGGCGALHLHAEMSSRV